VPFRFPDPFLPTPSGDWNPSFVDFLTSQHPHLLTRWEGVAPGGEDAAVPAPHGTTILALRHGAGALIAGDRQATEGTQVAGRRIEKVYRADRYSAIAIAGVAGPCLEMARLFQTELEHYEKLEGAELSTEGKANKLAQMVKMNLPLAMQGLIVIPIFVGYDPRRGDGKIFKYDVTGGRYEETDYYATGSGGRDARATMKKLYRPGLAEAEALRVVLEALYDAAEEDVGTAGPDFVRGIFPTVKNVTASGIADIPDETIRTIYEGILASRKAG
jgi:proteasome beta subunit